MSNECWRNCPVADNDTYDGYCARHAMWDMERRITELEKELELNERPKPQRYNSALES